MATIFYDADADLGLLEGKVVAVLGYGSQGHAHANNLKDSGVSVIVGLHADSTSRERAAAAGLTVLNTAEAAKQGDVIMMALPDTKQKAIYERDVAPNLEAGNMLMVAHGFTVHYGQVVPPADVDVALIAPKSPGHLVRRTYTEGNGTPGLVAVHQDATGNARAIALAYGKGIGCTQAGVIETTFQEETETDLFGEQAVLCGGAAELIKRGFETLTEAGYQPEVAYFECLHELKLIVDLFYEGGLKRMNYSVSDTAEWGGYVSGPRVVDEGAKERMRDVLTEIQDGTFAKRWIAENETGREEFNALRTQNAEHPIEGVGAQLREMMSWLPKPEN